MFGLDWKQSPLWGWFIFSFLLFFTIGKTSSSNISFQVLEGHKEKWKRAQIWSKKNLSQISHLPRMHALRQILLSSQSFSSFIWKMGIKIYSSYQKFFVKSKVYVNVSSHFELIEQRGNNVPQITACIESIINWSFSRCGSHSDELFLLWVFS